MLVVGGSGYFGQLIVDELLRYTGFAVVVGARTSGRLSAVCSRFGPQAAHRLSGRALDLGDPASVESAVSEAQVAICAAGPFQRLPLTLLEACLKKGVHYIDIADDRSFVRKVRDRVQEHDGARDLPAVCTGWSAVPALSALLARIATREMERVQTIRIQIAPGNRNPRNAGTVASLLSSLGRPFPIWHGGGWRTVRGWSEPRAFEFPPPVGKQVGYLIDVPDHEIFPQLFGAEGVEFRVGSELSLLNHAVTAVAWCARRGFPQDLASWTPLLRGGAALFGFFGHDWGAVGVEASGERGGGRSVRRVSIVAARAGQRIPVLPPVAMSALLLSGDRVPGGLVAPDRWLTPEQLRTECARRGYRLEVVEPC